jgi:Flp pilus assembly pilin Flp
MLTRLGPDDGQAMAEYALILALIVGAALVAMAALTGGIGNMVSTLTSALG